MHDEPLHPGRHLEVEVIAVRPVVVGRQHHVEEVRVRRVADDAAAARAPPASPGAGPRPRRTSWRRCGRGSRARTSSVVPSFFTKAPASMASAPGCRDASLPSGQLATGGRYTEKWMTSMMSCAASCAAKSSSARARRQSTISHGLEARCVGGQAGAEGDAVQRPREAHRGEDAARLVDRGEGDAAPRRARPRSVARSSRP